MKAKGGHVAWLALSHHDHFSITLNPTSNNQQVFRLRAHLAKPVTIHPHRILGDSDLYEQSDPALRLAIQYCPGEKDGGQGFSWQWASKKPSSKSLFRMNTLVDVLEGIPTESTMVRPRRCWRAYHADGTYTMEWSRMRYLSIVRPALDIIRHGKMAERSKALRSRVDLFPITRGFAVSKDAGVRIPFLSYFFDKEKSFYFYSSLFSTLLPYTPCIYRLQTSLLLYKK